MTQAHCTMQFRSQQFIAESNGTRITGDRSRVGRLYNIRTRTQCNFAVGAKSASSPGGLIPTHVNKNSEWSALYIRHLQ